MRYILRACRSCEVAGDTIGVEMKEIDVMNIKTLTYNGEFIKLMCKNKFNNGLYIINNHNSIPKINISDDFAFDYIEVGEFILFSSRLRNAIYRIDEKISYGDIILSSESGGRAIYKNYKYINIPIITELDMKKSINVFMVKNGGVVFCTDSIYNSPFVFTCSGIDFI